MVIRSRDELATTLERRIVGGDLAPGELLPSERVLSEEYGLSRSMVREALRSLAERRLIDVVPGRGSFVRGPSAEESAERLTEVFDQRQVTARHLIEARTMLETTAAWLAAERATAPELDMIAASLITFDRASTLAERVAGDLAFHVAVVRAAGNPMVETMFVAIRPFTVELMVRSLSDEAVTSESVPFHQKVYDAIATRQPSVASDAMFDHLAVGLTVYGEDLDRNLEVVSRRAAGRAGHPGLDDLLRGVPG